MVNWRENIEFIYGLITLLAIVLTYFRLYNWTGIPFALGATAALAAAMIGAGLVAFESEQAIERWNRLTKKTS